MRMNEAFPGKYLAAADLKRPCTVMVDRVEKQDVSGGQDAPEEKPVVYFKGQEKGLVLNQTNFGTLATLHGDESDDWEGCRCELYPTTTEFRGKMVPCIRVRAAEPVRPEPDDAKLQREADAAEAGPF